ncbi:hypothetical protein CVT25_010609 [Psilocybe cyanescens]|uniref:Uncharacterized protein n=1 Tax=Psilocybe cyanescens TaxID=93625 RepID=A0A409XV78_PSICY|nr:hypothetical protein CVT25_010609 [Psilocybe cyanescens]
MVQAVSTWCSNNWRADRGIACKSNHFRPKRPDVLWHNHQAMVWAEIANIMGIEKASADTFGWFRYRTAVIKNIWTRMTEGERKAIDNEVDMCAMKGYNEHTQASLAKKYHVKRIDQSMKDQYNEMGMTSVIFVCFPLPDGKIAVDGYVNDRLPSNRNQGHIPSAEIISGPTNVCGRYKQIANLMNVPAQSFMSIYKADVDWMKQNILDYMTGLQNLKKNGHLAFTVNRTPTKKPIFTFGNTTSGFPIIPIPLPDKNWTKMSTISDILGPDTYDCLVGLATGGITDKVLYTEIGKNQKTFIPSKYLPLNMKFANPRNLHKEDIQAFFAHLVHRQQIYQPQDTFRFRCIKHKHGPVPTRYPDDQLVANRARRKPGHKDGNGRKHKERLPIE